ncbi:hypothetical protein BACI348_50068 [Bacillus altitudinis]|uniref:Uncharacterized protein n=1 Tax=Bacillus altitudinis TaxID=293387 RepID=A0A653V887_BACAB|nr:hypothetical protein BACI348_50068 [Bacillus altitudinis]
MKVLDILKTNSVLVIHQYTKKKPGCANIPAVYNEALKGLANQSDSFKDRLSLQPSKAQGESIFCLYTSTKQG